MPSLGLFPLHLAVDFKCYLVLYGDVLLITHSHFVLVYAGLVRISPGTKHIP